MPLYATIDRVHRELQALGSGPLEPAQLYAFDQFHYLGTDAVRHAAERLAIESRHHVAEVGAGIGGPARFLAATTGCRVTAIELQPELHDIAVDLTARCGLATRVTHVLGDARTSLPETATFDAAVSWLAIHHILDRPRLLRRIQAALVPAGRVYIEDLYVRAPLSDADARAVLETLYGVTMSSAADYVEDLRRAGFEDVVAEDMTEPWTAFCAARAESWRAARNRHVRVHGEAIYQTLEHFFTSVRQLFEHGGVGGARLTGTVPSRVPKGP
jgi:cyclopropane fatty-acyl-phospholipid synthase-like methyltransferase